MPVKVTGPVVFYWPEQSSFGIAAMSRQRKILLDHPLGGGVHRDEAYLVALAHDPKMSDALTGAPDHKKTATTDRVVADKNGRATSSGV
jgi:hypothetical protein